jgi:hypothetical protein
MIQTDGPGHRRALTLRERRDPLKVGLYCDEPALVLNLLREATQKAPTT